jgi:hypothetical protein
MLSIPHSITAKATSVLLAPRQTAQPQPPPMMNCNAQAAQIASLSQRLDAAVMSASQSVAAIQTSAGLKISSLSTALQQFLVSNIGARQTISAVQNSASIAGANASIAILAASMEASRAIASVAANPSTVMVTATVSGPVVSVVMPQTQTQVETRIQTVTAMVCSKGVFMYPPQKWHYCWNSQEPRFSQFRLRKQWRPRRNAIPLSRKPQVSHLSPQLERSDFLYWLSSAIFYSEVGHAGSYQEVRYRRLQIQGLEERE